jgi:hypothetical protein
MTQIQQEKTKSLRLYFQLIHHCQKNSFKRLLKAHDGGLMSKLLSMIEQPISRAVLFENRAKSELPLVEKMELFLKLATDQLTAFKGDAGIHFTKSQANAKLSPAELYEIDSTIFFNERTVGFEVHNALVALCDFVLACDTFENRTANPSFNRVLEHYLSDPQPLIEGYPFDLLVVDREMVERHNGGVLLVNKRWYSSRFYRPDEIREVERVLKGDADFLRFDIKPIVKAA